MTKQSGLHFVHSAYDNVLTVDNFWSILPCVKSINACLVMVMMSAEAEPKGSHIVKKWKVMVKSVQKWVQENDNALNTATWLTFDKLDREDVATLKCSVCIKFEKKLQSTRNYNAAFIVGSTNLQTSSFKDHAATDMHKLAMLPCA